jgi:hypothetical protein
MISRKQQAVVTAFTILMGALAPAGAAAAPPDVCASPPGLSGYNQGVDLERRVLDTLWTINNYSCTTLDPYLAGINVPVSTAGLTDVSLMCRNVGMADAISDTIRSRIESCTGQCTISGTSIGTVAANQLCSVPPAFPSPTYTAPAYLCSVVSGQGCRTAFDSVVRDRCPWRQGGQGYQDALNAACGNL